MATDRRAVFAVPAAAALLLWPALWNGYPTVFADTGTYLSQAIHHYAGWDRPVFYSLFMLALHWQVTLWPVIAAQALIAAWVLWLAWRVLTGNAPVPGFAALIAILSTMTWLPWTVSELMPDLFTPLLVVALALLAWAPDRLSAWERWALAALATFFIATQQSSLPLSLGLAAGCALARTISSTPALDRSAPPPSGAFNPSRDTDCSVPTPLGDCTPPSWWAKAHHPRLSGSRHRKGGGSRCSPTTKTIEPPQRSGSRRAARRSTIQPHRRPGHFLYALPWQLIAPPALAAALLCTMNLAAFGRFAVSPYGNIFLLARVIYDGPGIATLHARCPQAGWRLCPFVDQLPQTSDEFLWRPDSPLYLAGGPKAVSTEATTIIGTALKSHPWQEIYAALGNAEAQLAQFDCGDGLQPWPMQVSKWLTADFPFAEAATYRAARQQTGQLRIPSTLLLLHRIVALAGVLLCCGLLTLAPGLGRPHTAFLLTVLLSLPLNATITGALSAPHDRYQSRIMWLPAFAGIASCVGVRPRRP